MQVIRLVCWLNEHLLFDIRDQMLNAVYLFKMG